jgi:xanthine dehydrogenase molybdenum-binding subunit
MVARGEVPVLVNPGGVGTRTVKYEAEALALGDRGYIDDIRIPGMLHAALVFTQHTRADVTAIDPTAALQMPGVRKVFTAADIPGELMVGIIYKDWPVMIPIGGRTSYAGDVLAIVVAETRDEARAATQFVEVQYTVHTPLTDPLAAMTSSEIAVWQTDNNILSTSRYKRGDTDIAMSKSAHVVEETFVTQRIEHAFLEPESTVAVPSHDGKSLHVYSGGQMTSPKYSISTTRKSPSNWSLTVVRLVAKKT